MNDSKKNTHRIIHDERDEHIETRGKRYAAEVMISFTQVCWAISLIKRLDSAPWGFFSILMSGLTVLLFYHYDKNEAKPYLYGSILFGIITVIALIKFILV
ncbi:MAG: DUF6442 family protein [bacterium]|nr:DUF6442 family protein [bacterium]